jgi:heme-degrading monooxygenase HmoA
MTALLETVVCSAKPGTEARLERIFSSRIEFRNRQDGCIQSWYSRSSEDESLYIFQTVFKDRESMKLISDKSRDKLDSNDGGIQSCLIGPPLVGIFTVEDDLLLKFRNMSK